jgi:hypothetical protein
MARSSNVSEMARWMPTIGSQISTICRNLKSTKTIFGGVFGGPIFKDKTFFFFSDEGLRLRQPFTQQSVVPDAESRLQAPAAVLERVSYCEWFGSGARAEPPGHQKRRPPACGLMCAAHRHHFTEQWFDSLRCGRWWYVAHLFASRSWAERGTKYLLRAPLFRDQGRFSCTEYYGCSPKLQVARALRSVCS